MSNYTALYNMAASLIPPESDVVEWGCGTGEFAALIAPKCVIYSGYDISTNALADARLNAPSGDFYCTDITYQNLWDDKVRTYVALETLEHLDLMEDLALLKRVAVGSRIIISVPSFDSADHKIFFPEEWSAINHYAETINLDLWRKVQLPTGGGYFHLLRGFR